MGARIATPYGLRNDSGSGALVRFRRRCGGYARMYRGTVNALSLHLGVKIVCPNTLSVSQRAVGRFYSTFVK